MLVAPHPPRTTWITILALFSLLGGVMFFFGDLFSVFSSLYLMRSPEVQSAMRELRNYQPSGNAFLLNPEGVLISSVIGVFISLCAIGASIGLLLRKNWGRISYIVVVWVQSVYFAVVSIIGISAIKSFTEQPGMERMSGMTSVWRIGEWLTLAGALLLLILAVAVLWGLTRENVRREFGG